MKLEFVLPKARKSVAKRRLVLARLRRRDRRLRDARQPRLSSGRRLNGTPAHAADGGAAAGRLCRSGRPGEACGRLGAREDGADDQTDRSGLLDGAVRRQREHAALLPPVRHAGHAELPADAARPPDDHRAGLGLLHLGRRLCGDQLSRGRWREDRRDQDRRRQDLHRQGGRHRPEDRPRVDQGRRRTSRSRSSRSPTRRRASAIGWSRSAIRSASPAPRPPASSRRAAATSARVPTTTSSRSTRRSTRATPAARRSTPTAR